jgi:hypothetical protein
VTQPTAGLEDRPLRQCSRMSLEGVSGAEYVRSMEMRELGRDEVDLLWTIDRSEVHAPQETRRS